MNYMTELRSCLNGSRSKTTDKKAVTLDSFKSEVLALVETAPKVHYGEPHEVRMMAQKRDTIRKITAKDQYRRMLRVTISTVSPNCSSLRIMRWVEIWKR